MRYSAKRTTTTNKCGNIVDDSAQNQQFFVSQTNQDNLHSDDQPFYNTKQTKKTKGRQGQLKKSKKKKYVKGPWTPEDDRKLKQLVSIYGPKKWSIISKSIPGRIGKQCRARWFNYLDPNVKKEWWSVEEETLIIKAHFEFGNKWSKISKLLSGRTPNAIKNHWNSTLKRVVEKSKVLNDNVREVVLPPCPKRKRKNNPGASSPMRVRIKLGPVEPITETTTTTKTATRKVAKESVESLKEDEDDDLYHTSDESSDDTTPIINTRKRTRSMVKREASIVLKEDEEEEDEEEDKNYASNSSDDDDDDSTYTVEDSDEPMSDEPKCEGDFFHKGCFNRKKRILNLYNSNGDVKQQKKENLKQLSNKTNFFNESKSHSDSFMYVPPPLKKRRLNYLKKCGNFENPNWLMNASPFVRKFMSYYDNLLCNESYTMNKKQ